MITLEQVGHSPIMPEASLLVEEVAHLPPRQTVADVPAERRFATLLDEYYDFVWRSVRRLGVATADAEDAALRVFEVASRKLDAIRPGSERAFLFQAALRMAADYRRASRRRRDSDFTGLTEVAEAADPSPWSDELLEMRRAREQLDLILDTMPLEQRTVFVLHELEQTAMSEIASITGVPAGTVASRLRRARELFREGIDRLLRSLPVGGQE